MTIESSRDLQGLRDAGNTVATVLASLRQALEVGMTTADVDALCREALAQRGALAAPERDYGFPGSLCVSVNDEAVHGVPGRRVIDSGDLVKLDLVVLQEGYYADAAITVEVGSVSAADRRLARTARKALRRALSAVRAGERLNEIGRAVEKEALRAGFHVIPELGGHGVGAEIHEKPSVPNFFDRWEPFVLHEGLVLAIEPILSAGPSRTVEGSDGWTLRTHDGSRVAHHEHTLVVTRGEPLILTSASAEAA